MRRRHDAVDDADTAGTQHHADAPPRHQRGLFARGLGEVHCQQLLVQIALRVQESGRALGIALEHLVDLAVPLGDVHVNHQPAARCRPLGLQQQLARQHVRRLRPQHDGDPTLGRAVPIVGKGQRRRQPRPAAGDVKGIQLTDLTRQPVRRQRVDRRRQPRTHAQFHKDLRPAGKRGRVITKRGGAGL